MDVFWNSILFDWFLHVSSLIIRYRTGQRDCSIAHACTLYAVFRRLAHPCKICENAQYRSEIAANAHAKRTHNFCANACKKTHAQTRVCAHLRAFDARISFCYSLSQLCFVWHSSAQKKKQDKRQFLQTPLKNTCISAEKQTADSHVVGVQSLITDKCPTFSQIFLLWTECKRKQS